MPNYLVENRYTGEVAYAYSSDTPSNTGVYPFETFNHILQKPLPQVEESRTLTKLAYLRLFTQEERIAIRNAASVSPELKDYLELLTLAEDISKDDPDIASALALLETVGLLAAGRAAEILA